MYWKTLFMDFIEVAVINSYLLFKLWYIEHPGKIPRRKHARHGDFWDHLIRQLADIDMHAAPPKRLYHGPAAGDQPPAAYLHLPGLQKKKRNCYHCWDT